MKRINQSKNLSAALLTGGYDRGGKRTGRPVARLRPGRHGLRNELRNGLWHDGRLWRRLDGWIRRDMGADLASHRGCRPRGMGRQAKAEVNG